jgi:hypothetical protein
MIFKVYGVSRITCDHKARKTVRARNLSLSEWEAKVAIERDRLFDESKPGPVSATLSTPERCREFIQLSDKKNFRDLRVYIYIKNGKITKSGKEARQWVPYTNQA